MRGWRPPHGSRSPQSPEAQPTPGPRSAGRGPWPPLAPRSGALKPFAADPTLSMRVVVKEAKSVRSCLIEEVFLHSLARSAKRCHSSARVSLVRRLTLDPEIVTKPRSIRAGPKVTGSLAPQATHASIPSRLGSVQPANGCPVTRSGSRHSGQRSNSVSGLRSLRHVSARRNASSALTNRKR